MGKRARKRCPKSFSCWNAGAARYSRRIAARCRPEASRLVGHSAWSRPPEGAAFLLLAAGLLFGSGGSGPRPAAGFLVSLIPFRDECLMRSRVAFIADAPAGRVIGLRGVAQLMAQMNLVGGLRRFRLETALLNCPIIRPISSNRSFCYTAYHSL